MRLIKEDIFSKILKLTRPIPKTKSINGNISAEYSNHLSIKKISNFLVIQMPGTNRVGKDMRINLFNATGRTFYTTDMKLKAGTFYFSIAGLSRGVYHATITNGKSVEYSGSFTITR